MRNAELRSIVVLAALLLAACTEADATRIGDRTFRIEGPALPSESSAPNRRVAERLCPNGFRVLTEQTKRNTPDGGRDEPGMFTNWTVRCL
jgi:hypothetical protein